MIRAAHPAIGDVVLSQYVEPDDARRLFEHGPDGRAYLLKERVADLGPGAALGERAAIEGGVRTATLRAVTDCKVAAVPPTATVARSHPPDTSGVAFILLRAR